MNSLEVTIILLKLILSVHHVKVIDLSTKCGTIHVHLSKDIYFHFHSSLLFFKLQTENRGWGVRTLQPIRHSSFIIEYLGEVISVKELWKRALDDYQYQKHHYCLNLDGGMVIDGYRYGNEGRFVNHSCNPNCEMQKW